MTSENFEEIFQLINDHVTKENTKIRELIPPRLQRAVTIGFLSTGELYKGYVYKYYSFYLKAQWQIWDILQGVSSLRI